MELLLTVLTKYNFNVKGICIRYKVQITLSKFVSRIILFYCKIIIVKRRRNSKIIFNYSA